MDWKIKTADVWLTSVDLRWVCEGENGLSRSLVVSVTDTYMSLKAYIMYQDDTLLRMHLELQDRFKDVNIWITDMEQIEDAFNRVMREGKRTY
jgi:hypothetical protein